MNVSDMEVTGVLTSLAHRPLMLEELRSSSSSSSSSSSTGFRLESSQTSHDNDNDNHRLEEYIQNMEASFNNAMELIRATQDEESKQAKIKSLLVVIERLSMNASSSLES